MARDLGLLGRARESRETVFSVYGWTRPTLSLGRNQRARGCYDLDRLRDMGRGRAGAPASPPPAPPPPPATRPTDAPCFATPARGELTFLDRKLVGSAQWREDGAFLQHGSILIEDDQSTIAEFSRGLNGAIPIPPPATLSGAMGRAPETIEIRDALFGAVRRLEDRDAILLDESEVTECTMAELPHFENELWTWRR